MPLKMSRSFILSSFGALHATEILQFQSPTPVLVGCHSHSSFSYKSRKFMCKCHSINKSEPSLIESKFTFISLNKGVFFFFISQIFLLMYIFKFLFCSNCSILLYVAPKYVYNGSVWQTSTSLSFLNDFFFSITLNSTC